MKPTQEQIECIAAFMRRDSLKINAFAGTGKTTTLTQLARSDKGERAGLYIAFNRSIANEAQAKFPEKVNCKTAHSLAYGAVGWRYKNRLQRFTHKHVAEVLQLEGKKIPYLTAAQMALAVIDTLTRFSYSDQRILSVGNVPRLALAEVPEESKIAVSLEIIRYTGELWQLMTNPKGRFPITHDVYLKLWQLSDPVLPADYILFDEAQDASAVMLSVLKQQKHSQLVVVGDPYQQIYCQPVGTMVAIPSKAKSVEHKYQCCLEICKKQRSHKKSGLCNAHELQRRRGEKFKPLNSYPKNIDPVHVPIESLNVGDNVITYDNSHVFKRGRPIDHISRFHFEGNLISVNTSKGLSSRYTPKHQCIVRVGDNLKGKHVVYLMKRNNQYRIGRVPFFYSSQNNVFGLALRSSCEKANAAWILSIHDSAKDAALKEALYWSKYKIPGIRFEGSDIKGRDLLDVKEFWKLHGENEDEAENCLSDFGLLVDFPLWTSGLNSLIGVRRPFVTAAANLLDGFMVLPLGNEYKQKGKQDYSAGKKAWETITVSKDFYCGDVVSLEVADHHTYYADGILTHNSWRGAVNAMDQIQADTTCSLSQSFRFGEAIAEVANNVLQSKLNARVKLKGTPTINSQVCKVKNPRAALCRTNMTLIKRVIEEINDGKSVSVVGGTQQVISLIEGADSLQQGYRTRSPELAVFKSWEEVVELSETEAGKDLSVLVSIMNKYEPEEIIKVLRKNNTEENKADIVLSTAHKSKGREWSSVSLADDFRSESEKGYTKEDDNLIYVAATRGINKLDITNCKAVGF